MQVANLCTLSIKIIKMELKSSSLQTLKQDKRSFIKRFLFIISSLVIEFMKKIYDKNTMCLTFDYWFDDIEWAHRNLLWEFNTEEEVIETMYSLFWTRSCFWASSDSSWALSFSMTSTLWGLGWLWTLACCWGEPDRSPSRAYWLALYRALPMYGLSPSPPLSSPS